MQVYGLFYYTSSPLLTCFIYNNFLPFCRSPDHLKAVSPLTSLEWTVSTVLLDLKHLRVQLLSVVGADDLDILTALLAESEGVGEEQDSQQQADDLNGLCDNDEEEEEYKEGAEEEGQDMWGQKLDLFGDLDDIGNEESDAKGQESRGEACESVNRSKEDLQGSCCSSFTLKSASS